MKTSQQQAKPKSKPKIKAMGKKLVKQTSKQTTKTTKSNKIKKVVKRNSKTPAKKPTYQISNYMTPAPHTIGLDQTLDSAINMMNNYKIRHIPVLNGGVLVGIISDRDLKGVMTLKDVDPEKVTVAEALTEDLYQVEPSALLGQVCGEMADKKFGSALVVDNGKLVGIFTWIDALMAMKDFLAK